MDEAKGSREFQYAPRPIARGERIEVATHTHHALLGRGWSFVQGEGRWTMDDVASMALPVAGDPQAPATLHIEASASLCGPRTENDVDVLVNGAPAGSLHFTHETNDLGRARAVSLPEGALATRPTLIELRPRDVRSPRSMGCNDDWRKLGLYVRNVWIE
jgi:hypothetical protein